VTNKIIKAVKEEVEFLKSLRPQPRKTTKKKG
jgi:hypothetical protein